MHLAAEGLTKSYGHTRALREVTFSLRDGEVLGLAGENGSGKSTLLRLLAGVEAPDNGAIKIDGKTVHANGLSVATRNGIGLVFQELSLISSLPVFENFFLRAPEIGFQSGVLRAKPLKQLCRKIFARYGFDCDPAEVTGRLPFHQRQLLEVIREIEVPRLSGAPRSILLLDEPTTALSQREAERLMAILKNVVAAGATIVFVSHRLNETLALADRILVLRDGAQVTEREKGQTNASELQALMVGREGAADYFSAAARVAVEPDVLIELRDATGTGFHDVNLTVKKNEIVGLAGLESSGKSELCEAIHGLRRIERGQMSIYGRVVKGATPSAQVKRGVAYVPKERLAGGIIENETIERNVGLHLLRSRSWVDKRAERNVAAQVIRRFGVKASSTTSTLSSLSGGNQQKVTLGKWLIDSPSLIVLDNPTRGVDVGARAEIYRAIRAAVRGSGVLMASDELSELLGLCDRIYVMKDKSVVQEVLQAELEGEGADRERALVRHMV